MRKRCFVPQMISIITKLDKPLKSFNCRAYRGLTSQNRRSNQSNGEVMLRLGKKGFLTAILAAGLLPVALTPAMAQAGNLTYCASTSWVCIYDDAYHERGLGARTAGFALTNVSGTANDRMTSWENRSKQNARWYVDANAAGACHSMPNESEVPWVALTQENRLTSWAGNGVC
ncbi:peptidase inhibitor family I36 protein [Neomicrococcus lactis]|uniref:peptidase inhibitor family I36 protein n=1 Tax=Neomicrococcus lactis TaxID=732241 RepID=UPI003A5C86EE